MIYIECYADEVLIKSILSNITRKEYAHSGNKAAVIKQLIKQNDGSGHIGLVDKDPGSHPPAYYEEFRRESVFNQLEIELMKASNGSRLVVISPNLEDWVISSAHFIHVRLRDYRLPEDSRELHKKLLSNKKYCIFFC